MIQRKGLVEFKGGFDEAMDRGEHGTPFAEKCESCKARTAKSKRSISPSGAYADAD